MEHSEEMAEGKSNCPLQPQGKKATLVAVFLPPELERSEVTVLNYVVANRTNSALRFWSHGIIFEIWIIAAVHLCCACWDLFYHSPISASIQWCCHSSREAFWLFQIERDNIGNGSVREWCVLLLCMCFLFWAREGNDLILAMCKCILMVTDY